MPAQQGVGLHNDEGLPPVADAAGQQDQECAVTRRTRGPLDAAPQDDELVP
jgi:hypothetical protein